MWHVGVTSCGAGPLSDGSRLRRRYYLSDSWFGCCSRRCSVGRPGGRSGGRSCRCFGRHRLSRGRHGSRPRPLFEAIGDARQARACCHTPRSRAARRDAQPQHRPAVVGAHILRVVRLVNNSDCPRDALLGMSYVMRLKTVKNRRPCCRDADTAGGGTAGFRAMSSSDRSNQPGGAPRLHRRPRTPRRERLWQDSHRAGAAAPRRPSAARGPRALPRWLERSLRWARVLHRPPAAPRISPRLSLPIARSSDPGIALPRRSLRSPPSPLPSCRIDLDG